MNFSDRARTAGLFLAAIVAAGCSRAMLSPAELPPTPLAGAQQLVVVVTPDWNATTGTLRRFARSDAGGAWLSAGDAIPIVVGRTGLAWGDETLRPDASQPVKHEGDGKSPAGAFPLDTAFGFAPRADLAWLRLPYVALTPTSDCVDDESSAYYNTVVDRAAVPRIDWNSAEHMREISLYRLGVIVGYNAAPPRRGRGSCIFLHIWSGPQSVTAGCTAMDASALTALVQWLDRSRRPVIVQLPAAEYERLRTAWRMP
jgi:D-alanyl-D-alanine dipeptidase